MLIRKRLIYISLDVICQTLQKYKLLILIAFVFDLLVLHGLTRHVGSPLEHPVNPLDTTMIGYKYS